MQTHIYEYTSQKEEGLLQERAGKKKTEKGNEGETSK